MPAITGFRIGLANSPSCNAVVTEAKVLMVKRRSSMHDICRELPVT